MDDGVGVDAVEWTVVDANVVEAEVDRGSLEAAGAFDVVEVAVDVVVDGVMVDHLGDGDIVEVAGIAGAAQILGEYLHEHGFAYPYPTLQEDVFVEFVTSARKYLFASRGTVEVQEEEFDYVAVVVVDDEGAALWGEDSIGDVEQEVGMSIVDFGIVDVGDPFAGAQGFVLDAQGYGMEGFPRFAGLPGFHDGEEGAVPFDVAGGPVAVFFEFLPEAGGILVFHVARGLYVLSTEATVVGVVVLGLGLYVLFDGLFEFLFL